MSYHIYTTKGFILSSRPYREADRVYSILTRDLGLIRATGTGVRKEVSKLRGSLEPLALSEVSLVRGQEFWRLTSAQSIKAISVTAELARPLLLLEKLVPGETVHPELFDVLEDFILNQPRDENFETKLVSRILYELGYLKPEDLTLDKPGLIKAINEGLKQSHLV